MRNTARAMAAIVAIGALGCGSSTTKTDTAAQERAAARRAAAARAAKLRVRQQAEYVACEGALGDLRNELAALDSRLSIGLTYDKYTSAVADVKVLYDRVDFSGVDASSSCVEAVGIPLERALNQHLRAQTTWNACFESYDCDQDSIDSALQDRWLKASRSVEKARANLIGMRPDA